MGQSSFKACSSHVKSVLQILLPLFENDLKTVIPSRPTVIFSPPPLLELELLLLLLWLLPASQRFPLNAFFSLSLNRIQILLHCFLRNQYSNLSTKPALIGTNLSQDIIHASIRHLFWKCINVIKASI